MGESGDKDGGQTLGKIQRWNENSRGTKWERYDRRWPHTPRQTASQKSVQTVYFQLWFYFLSSFIRKCLNAGVVLGDGARGRVHSAYPLQLIRSGHCSFNKSCAGVQGARGVLCTNLIFLNALLLVCMPWLLYFFPSLHSQVSKYPLRLEEGTVKRKADVWPLQTKHSTMTRSPCLTSVLQIQGFCLRGVEKRSPLALSHLLSYDITSTQTPTETNPLNPTLIFKTCTEC